ncbi:fasciclin domain-containing protein [Branchiibius hedensis]|uniref:Fasciclin domain-containing protein n=1 Tax=Branchiibius hedensis TaxID=672460 RepID=A0A2Y8ZVS3_9MICO|nr:fasciclin domain-containing protein [Branchiibius hedensis]PWJ27373.1 fasciclin domain-containing protein [Branchiibius hedensis]SSA36184.1 Fasciclin domain-containing protein [Branchiibius hedensis]
MQKRHLVPVAVAITLAVPALAVAPASADSAPASAQSKAAAPAGSRSLAAYLTAGGVGFDNNPFDYDIVTAAVLAVVKAKPSSPVALLAQGNVPLTAFLPEDFAFRNLVHDLTGKWVRSEQQVFNVVGSLGIDTIEQILEYHVVPGKTIDALTALRSDNAVLPTALAGKTFTVDVLKPLPLIRLKDNDPNAADPYVNLFQLNLNYGNKQIAHGITAVLRPADL